MLMDAEVKKLEDEIKESFLVEKPRVVWQGAHTHSDKWENYRRKLISLLPWFGPYITQRSNQESALQPVERTTRTAEDFLWTILRGEMELRMGGATT